ncbi:mycofactocin-coupled SDR family oxidoreductase [Nocardioides sp. LS1]|uniref:mycofactocin-coupled SDR family oxidoreductase n=1 Tax=Nocardioides sp. LS1 TaxID=1027620 RepID=UPI000F61A3AC|nr:mycofactocin-coupled SDR family oxidoreductase [Nocardioides sp. LS1]GCD88164.1 3-ketoacyl-ACP reductase [Nocardioides sp. LS1]
MTRVALVTGAARGIGAATVRRLAGQGYRVVAVDWCAENHLDVPYQLPGRHELEALAVEHPDAVLPIVADVRDREAIDAAVAAATGRWGRLDVAVAAAAVMIGGTPLWETPAADLDLLWDIDARGVWNTAAACIPPMLASSDPGGCRFVAVASAAGTRGLFGLAAYSATKHAVIGLVKGLAADLVGTGVTAVAVSPGSTRTDMLAATADLYGLESVEEFAHTQLIRRLIEPDEIAATIAFCCSPQGAVLNGSVVHADGGFPG